MRTALTFAGLFHSDPDHAPFGTRFLRGLTPARVALVIAFCAVFSVRQNNFVSGSVLDSLQYLAVQVFCYLPMLLLVTMADNLTIGAGYRREGKQYVTVAVGCTGGKHRSVVMAEEIAAQLAGTGLGIGVVHRDLGRE